MGKCSSTHNLYTLGSAVRAGEIAGVFAFVFVPLASAIVAKHYLLSLGRLEVLAPGCHLILPRLLVSREGGNAGNAEADYEAKCSQYPRSHSDVGELRLSTVLLSLGLW